MAYLDMTSATGQDRRSACLAAIQATTVSDDGAAIGNSIVVAYVRAVWLFSRNDAIGNLAVVIAAGVVWLPASRWPDLIVAFAIAALFLQSAWSIICDARGDLRQASRP
ncbi:hypothetical protein AU467_22575 [Mesorhizobium loti]|uniref:Cation efflux protein transmembrane domain-containing protein n=1 Tax=Rhizobium loti TaxID=381 RepID=A0A101KSX3_RHILI|nr:hypothetical protein AU467_22575 [Mesorhizobium loti]